MPGVDVIVARIEEFRERMLFVDRHDLTADGVGRAVERDGEPELERFVGKLPDAGGEADGADGDFAGTDAEAVGGVDDAEGAEEVFVVGERFAHAHDDDVADFLFREGLDVEDLVDDLGSGEVAFHAFETRGAEFAAVGTADLGGDTHGMPVALGGEAGGGRYEDGFDEGMVAELEEEFFGGVGGVAGVDGGNGVEFKLGGELVAECGRQVRHAGEGVGWFLVDPLKNLIRPVGLVAEVGEFVPVEGFDVSFEGHGLRLPIFSALR